jgi:hypothetical protein
MKAIGKYTVSGIVALSLVGCAVSAAAAAPLVAQPALLSGNAASSLMLARYVAHRRIVVGRPVVRRRYYGPGPGVALGLFGAALGAAAISSSYDCSYYDCGYPAYGGPSYNYGPTYYRGAYVRAYRGARVVGYHGGAASGARAGFHGGTATRRR